MDVRLFKFLVFAAAETALALLYFLLRNVSFLYQYRPFLSIAILLVCLSVPILLLLPEDNWIWIVEEDPRLRKITLRSKAVKHLHLSMLYLLSVGLPALVFGATVMIKNPTYSYPIGIITVPACIALGAYCARRNFFNVKKYESLFALAWERRAPFIEIFVGTKTSRKPKYFYPKPVMCLILLLLLSPAIAPYVYYSKYNLQIVPYDHEKFVVMISLATFLASFGSCLVSMYTVFQIFFSRSLERWIKEAKGKNKQEAPHEQIKEND